MSRKYESAEISVDTDGTELALTNADIYGFSFYPTDGNITIELYHNGSYGNTIKGYSQVAMQEEFECQKIRVKALSGTVLVAYFIKGK